MKKLRSSSCCNTFFFFFFFLYSTICLLLKIAPTNGLTQLHSNGICMNIINSSSSSNIVLNIDNFGAKGDGFTDDTKSFQDAWKIACSSSSRAIIVVPSGNFYLVRQTDFAGPCLSKVILKVSGIIVAPNDPTLWDGLDVRKWLYFHRVRHLKVEGGGVIDGSGKKWWDRPCKSNNSNPCTDAPTALTFNKCKNLKVKNISLFNSPQTHMAFNQCTRVTASSVNVITPADNPNMGGVQINASTHVELKDVAVGTGGDCVSIDGNSSAIHVKNIFCGSGNGISIGSLGKYNSSVSVHDVVVNGAVLLNTVNGVGIKTWQGGSGSARNITFENIWMENVANPIIIDQYYCDSPVPCPNQTSAVIIDKITFRGIRGTTTTVEAMRLVCSDSYPCKRIHFENIQLTTSDGTAAKSFCWEAYGMSSRLVHPPSCVSSGDIIIRHRAKSNSTSWLNDDYALF